MNEEESRLQHIKDAEKTLKILESMKSNLGGGYEWKHIEESRLQHIKDANKVLKELDSMKPNMSGGYKWEDIVEVRKRHIESFLISLEK